MQTARNTETLTIRDLSIIADEVESERIAEFLGDDWANEPEGREVVVIYDQHNRLKRLDSETVYHWAE
jgi:hypothetical protein